MTSEHVPDTKDTPLIEQALQRRLEADTLRKSKELEERKKREDRDAFVKLITSQFYREIIEPLKVFISDFNSRYHGDKIILSPGTSTTLGHNISTPSGISIRLQIEPILTENFEREVIIEDYGREIRQRKVIIPKLRDRKVMAWGFVAAGDGKGFNLLLAEQRDEIYGEWVMLVNKLGWPSNVERRPEPFSFRLQELEKELRCINAIHVYSTDVRNLDIDFVKTFVADYF